jgi:DNA-directed RNA polymerase, mitochondrial
MDNRYDRQRKLEEEALQMGIKAYRDALAEDGAGVLPPGKRLMLSAMVPMVEAVKDWTTKAREGVARRNASIVDFIEQFDPESVAYLTAQTVIGCLHERPSAGTVCSRIGAILEQHEQIDEIAKGNKWLAEKVARLRSQYNARNQMVILRKVAQRNDAKIISWSDLHRVKVGGTLLEMFCQSTELATIETITTGRKDRVQIVRPTDGCRQWLEREHAKCELLNPFRFPMLCKPRDWTNPRNGGYLTQKLKQPLVKTRNKHLLSDMAAVEMPKVYAAVNALQGTEWAVNEAVYEVVKALWESSSTAGGLPSRDATPLPAKAHDETAPADDPRLLAWKREAAKVYEANAKAESKRLQLVQKLYVAERMIAEGNSFHFVYNMDWRGRLYPVASGLNPQGDDVAKALLRFAKAVPLGDEGAYWLAVHGANCFGVDKVSFDERVQWVRDNEADVLLCGVDQSTMWMQADNPFQFLAFCKEYTHLQVWVNQGWPQESFPSNLPVAFDGACNGLQNFSAMLRDEIGGAATGLVPDSKPSDIYTAVAQRAQALIDRAAADGEDVARKWIGKMTRKLAKRNTMTVPYGVSRYGMRDQLRQEFRKAAAEGDTFANSLTPEDAAFIAKVNYEAIGQTVVAARSAMDWLQEAAKVAASNGLPVRWTTPVGFLAVQDYRESEGTRADFIALGRRFQFVLERTGDKLNTRKQAAGISPNFVHSLDAAHLMLTVLFCAEDGVRDFAMVHDSYGCHAGHAALLRDNLREAFVSQYEGNVLGDFRDQLVAQLPAEVAEKIPPVPAFGTLDLTAVRRSEYFFA